MIMPVMSLAAIYLAIYARLMRSSIIEVSHAGFHQDGAGQGPRPAPHRVGHMLRNALVPVVTVAGMQAGALVGGAVVIETVSPGPALAGSPLRPCCSATIRCCSASS